MLKKAYFYFFYRLHRFFENYAIPAFWSEWKASLFIDGLLIFLTAAILFYAEVYIFPNSHLLQNGLFFSVGIAICIINYFIFHHKDTWKIYNKRFNAEKNRYPYGGIIILFVILFVISNFILSSYLYYLEKRQ